MSKKKKMSFLFEYDFLDFFEILSGDEVKTIIQDMVTYDKDEIEPNYNDRTMKLVFSKIKKIMDEHKEAYKLKCLKNSENQKERWHRKQEENTNVYERTQNDTNVSSRIKNNTNYTDYDNDYDNNSVYIYNTSNTKNENKKFCHFGNDFKIEGCKDCLKKEQCPNETDPTFLFEKGCSFEEWLAKKREYTKSMNSVGPPTPEMQQAMEELNDYNWVEDMHDD